jgi:hypothetical protein
MLVVIQGAKMASTVQHSALTGSEVHEPKGAATATSGQVYVSDGSGSGAWGNLAAANVDITDAGGYFTGTTVEAALQEIKPFAPAYGGMYITANTTAETATGAGTYDTWTTGWVASGDLQDVTIDVSTGDMAADIAGKYKIEATISFYQDAASAGTWLFAFDIDTVVQTKSIVSHTTSGTDKQTICLVAHLTLTANQAVAIRYQRASGTPDPIFNYCNMIMSRIA